MFNFQTMGNMVNMMNQFQANPSKFLSQKYNVPNDVKDPEKLIQHLLDTNQVTQEQIDGIKNNPMIQLFRGKL